MNHRNDQRRPNGLINEQSPYLLQHAYNPVDWRPWGAEALQKARDENKPIFLSIGYAACHWCHVMEHESFEDQETAALMNEHFLSIKVDREERPDLDSIYMNAVQTMTGQGGWPMSVFLTPRGEPFFGGTYYPPTRRYGMPSFREVLNAVIQAWRNNGDEIRKTGRDLATHLKENSAWGDTARDNALRDGVITQAARTLINSYDWSMGGWGRAPRFPQPMAIEFLMQQATRGTDRALDAAAHALRVMSRGGLYDVVGGGFHRYSTDDAWLVPHFEKMLYDNGQLALAYLHAYLLTGSLAFKQVCTETLDFVLREMTHPLGGFFSSLDADSEGVEGKYYVWQADEIDQILESAEDRELFHQVYTVTAHGNFEGKNILKRNADLEVLAQQVGMDLDVLYKRLDAIHQRLYEAREQRVRPATDDKVLVSWNALALRALAAAARYLKRDDYLSAARKNAAFLLDAMYLDGQLMRSWREGKARHAAFLEDHAGLILALTELYQSDHDPRWYHAAVQLGEDMMAHFKDPQGGFFDTSAAHGELIAQPKEIQDNASPSGNALAANALLRLAAYDERGDWQAEAEKMLAVLQDLMLRHPTAFAFWLQGLDFVTGPVRQVVIVGPKNYPSRQELVDTLWSTYRPRLVSAVTESAGESPALLKDRGMIGGAPTAYVCQGFTCNLPVNDAESMQKQIV